MSSHSSCQVIASLASLVYLIDRYQKFWLCLAWGFDSELSFYYICGKASMFDITCGYWNTIYILFARYRISIVGLFFVLLSKFLSQVLD